ncbi:MAG: hypothetical protein GC201_07110 [Alphaproteobacteria bacterium]|nr:hypothetical protein [Alphaproteobacteria bacterium]
MNSVKGAASSALRRSAANSRARSRCCCFLSQRLSMSFPVDVAGPVGVAGALPWSERAARVSDREIRRGGNMRLPVTSASHAGDKPCYNIDSLWRFGEGRQAGRQPFAYGECMPEVQVAAEPAVPYLRELLTFLLSAVVVVPASRLLRISPIIGFLGLGVLVGPSVLGIATNASNVDALAQLGVVFLLFTIGLDLSLDRLWRARRYVFGMGLLQVLGCGAVIGGIAYAWGNPADASALLGLSMALSSTAVVMQLLVERGHISSRSGRVSFAILLFQDLAVVPLLFLVGVLGSKGGGAHVLGFVLALGKSVGAVLIIFLLGRLLMRPLFRAVAGLRSPEVFMALTLLAVLGMAVVTQEAGLSMALGAFLAGLLLGESEFRHQIDADIQPFKGLLLGLFFISVGMRIDLSLIVDSWFLVAAAMLGLYMIKSMVITGLALAWRMPLGQALQTGLYLGQSGEFAFVVVGAAVAAGVLQPSASQFMLVVTALSMVMTPFASLGGERLARWMARRSSVSHIGAAPEEFADLEDHVVIAGFGRVGQTVGRMLTSQKTPYVALDLNSESLAGLYRQGMPVFFGDARRPAVLEKVGIDRAGSLVITLDDPAGVREVLQVARSRWPALRIFVRARDMDDARELMRDGHCEAVPEMVESSLQLGAEVLRSRGTPEEAIVPLVDGFRDQMYRTIRPRDEPSS